MESENAPGTLEIMINLRKQLKLYHWKTGNITYSLATIGRV